MLEKLRSQLETMISSPKPWDSRRNCDTWQVCVCQPWWWTQLLFPAVITSEQDLYFSGQFAVFNLIMPHYPRGVKGKV